MNRRSFAKALFFAATAFKDVVRDQFGAHLTSDDLAQIAKDFDEAAPQLEEMRKFKLTNADAPDFL